MPLPRHQTQPGQYLTKITIITPVPLQVEDPCPRRMALSSKENMLSSDWGRIKKIADGGNRSEEHEELGTLELARSISHHLLKSCIPSATQRLTMLM
jgi:hypothetical protein